MDKLKQDIDGCPGKAAGRPKAADVEARMQELLQIAGILFLKNGYTKTSLESIARAAHVAVRTIYVKFGGAKRDRFFRSQPMETDPRPFRDIVGDFAHQMHELLVSDEAVEMQRVVLAEAPTNPELADAFWNGGPRQTREMLARFFARPEIRAQMRPDVPLDLLPGFLMACICGEQLRTLICQRSRTPDDALHELEGRLELFYHSVLR
jgi:TetR/AcrR family transcriptional repressor of mexJK operon